MLKKIKWQDAVLTIGQAVFVASLLPSVFSAHKPALGTSLPTAIMLSSFVFVYRSLGLRVAATTASFAAGLWWILAAQVT